MNSRLAMVVHNERCIECGACELNCTTGAIKVTKGTGCLIVIIKEDILGLKAKCC
jgi:Fe-S-cluster-containing dehydrogenase component